MGTGAIIPMWIGIPTGVMMMLVVAAHVEATRRAGGAPSRRRIRTVNGVLMLMAIPLLTAGFSIINHQTHARLWVLVWFAAMVLLAFVVFFAVLDALNSYRLHRRKVAELRLMLAATRAEAHRRAAQSEPDPAERNDDR